MEHREPPRIGPGDRRRSTSRTDRARAGHFGCAASTTAGNSRKIDYRRAASCSSSAASGPGGESVFVGETRARSAGWRSSRSIRFRSTRSSWSTPPAPEPPRWYRGGSRPFSKMYGWTPVSRKRSPVLHVDGGSAVACRSRNMRGSRK